MSRRDDTEPVLPPLPSRSNERLTAVESAGELIEERTKKTLTDVRWLLALGLSSIAAIVVATAGTIAFAQDAGAKAVAPVAAEVVEVKTRIASIEKTQAEFGRISMETNLNVRLMLESRGIKPIDVPRGAADGGL